MSTRIHHSHQARAFAMRVVPIGLLLIILSPSLAAEETAPKPPAYGDAANDIPLDAYKKLHALYEAATGLFDFASPAAAELPPGVKTRDAAKGALAKAAADQHALLARALKASQALHRELAAKLLPKGGDPKPTVEALGSALPNEPDPGVRLACATGLSELKDAAAVDPLLKALRDDQEPVRAQAAVGLGELKDPRAVEGLLEVLQKDDKSSVRRRAANALKDIKDARAMDGLMKALENEQDYRVRMAIAGAVREIKGKDTVVAETESVMDQEEHENALVKLAEDMRGVEGKLRDDRHDQAVQVDQKDIEQRLNQLIEQVEQMQQQQQQGQCQKKQQSQQQQQQQQSQQAQQKKPSSPMADSKLGGGADRGALNAAEVAGRQAEWAKLPPSMREEMLQVYREGMPERWRRRLEAYYLSVAGEEVNQK